MEFMHYRTRDRKAQINARGGMTLAFEMDSNGDTIVAFAHCGRKDVFSRKMGRTIAEGRLHARSNKHIVTFNMPELNRDHPKSFVHNHAEVQAFIQSLYFDYR
jgi:hypothetical protein